MALSLLSSDLKHPHDLVTPLLRAMPVTVHSLPQSHRHLHRGILRPAKVILLSSLESTVKRPNLLDVRLMIFMLKAPSKIFSFHVVFEWL